MKVEIIFGLLMIGVVFVSGCFAEPNTPNWPKNCVEKDSFCESKGMTYICNSDYKYHIIFCTNCNDEKVPFTYEQFKNFTCKYNTCSCN